MATFNGLPYVKEQVESILAQSRPVQEVVICDDRSTDGTWDWLSAASTGDSRMRIYQNPQRLGSTRNFDRAIGLCRGDVIFLSDQDDIWLPEKVERLTAALQASGAALAMSNGQLVKEDGTDIGVTLWDANEINGQTVQGLQSASAFELLVRNSHITGAASCFKAALRDYFLPIPAGVWHDRWIAFVVSLIAPGRITLLDEKLYCHRQHSMNQVGARLLFRASIAGATSGLIALLRKGGRDVISQQDAAMDVEFCSMAIQRVNWIADHQPQILPIQSARRALELLQKRLEHSQARYAFIAHQAPLFSAFNLQRRQAYSEYSHGWSTIMRDLLNRLFNKHIEPMKK